MSAEATIHALLSSLVSSRVYPDIAPAGAALPRIVYQQVGGASPIYIEGTLPDRENARMQIVCWTATRLQAVALAKQVEELICASDLQATPLGARVSVYEEDTNTYGARQDFSVWPLR